MASFDRMNPLFERNHVPFEIVSFSNMADDNASKNPANPDKKYGEFAVRILRGHRPARTGDGSERVIRFELSDEFNRISAVSTERVYTRDALSNGNMQQHHQPPNNPIIRAPFMRADLHACNVHHSYHKEKYSDFQINESKYNNSILPIQLYELEVGESDFSSLRRDQALLVDFDDFANSMISLLQHCELGGGETLEGEDKKCNLDNSQHKQFPSSYQSSQHHGQCRMHDIENRMDWQEWNHYNRFQNGSKWNMNNEKWTTPRQSYNHHIQPQSEFKHHRGMASQSPFGRPTPVSIYTCRLETDSNPSINAAVPWMSEHKQDCNSSMMQALFSIVESNQFRELTHLALKLHVGTDKSVRLYLSCRLGQTLTQLKNNGILLREQKNRSETAENDLISLNKSMQELVQSADAEKREIRHQTEERIQLDRNSHIEEINRMKEAKDAEITALKGQIQKNQSIFDSQSRIMEETNQKLNTEKMVTDNENEKLATKLNIQETTNKSLRNELETIRIQFQKTSEEKITTEKNLHELQLQLSSLQNFNENNERNISRSEGHRISAEKLSANIKEALSRQQMELEDLRRRLYVAELEVSQYKDLTLRYQTSRSEMKKRIKEKVDTIREQEEALVEKENEVKEWKSKTQKIEESVLKLKTEKDDALRELKTSRQKMEADAKKLENNQQVISWLNKQMKESKGGNWVLKTTTHAHNNIHVREESTSMNNFVNTNSTEKYNINNGNKFSSQNRSSSLSRYLPATPYFPNQNMNTTPYLSNSTLDSTPYRRFHVTPDIQTVSLSHGLHPQPQPQPQQNIQRHIPHQPPQNNIENANSNNIHS
ncbi:hypothetical protein ACHAXS_010536 [Conticribra weissflogii]